jgi:hypothetical protein
VPFFCVAACIGLVALNNYYYLPETLQFNADNNSNVKKERVSYFEVIKSRVQEATSQWKLLVKNSDIKMVYYSYKQHRNSHHHHTPLS